MADSRRKVKLRREILNEVHKTLGDKLFSEFMIDMESEGLGQHYTINNLKSSAEIWLFSRYRNGNES